MTITAERKQELMKEYGAGANDKDFRIHNFLTAAGS